MRSDRELTLDGWILLYRVRKCINRVEAPLRSSPEHNAKMGCGKTFEQLMSKYEAVATRTWSSALEPVGQIIEAAQKESLPEDVGTEVLKKFLAMVGKRRGFSEVGVRGRTLLRKMENLERIERRSKEGAELNPRERRARGL